MFTIKLTYIKNFVDYLDKYKDKYALLYADFNVINYLHKTCYNPTNQNIIFYPDSTAVFLTLRILSGLKLKKLISTDLLDEFLHALILSQRKIFFFGNSDVVLKEMVEKLCYKYPDVNVCGYHNGYMFDNDIINEINKSGAEIIFVGLGAGKQEEWIIENFHKLNCRLIISCGGWFNLLSGINKRSPLWLRKNHLEWSYKLFSEFNRIWKRYLLGTPKYFYRNVTKKIQLEIIIPNVK